MAILAKQIKAEKSTRAPTMAFNPHPSPAGDPAAAGFYSPPPEKAISYQ
jgi:hypothetical protein